ncbi:MAG: peroxide stress protein YaaA [Friedmanniella sp.]|nr:peroxide stress protein YaaA [Friedmanniella sp.]
MLILLPPSEGKAAPARRGRAVDLAGLSAPELTPARVAVRDALVQASAGPDALERLGVGAGLAAEVAQNTRLATAAAAPAIRVYAGVLFAALDYNGLSPAARRRASRTVRVQSALWGPVRPLDLITPYRLSMGTSLPGVGPLAAFWRSRLDPVMVEAAGTGVVVDCRSATYAAAWRPAGAVARRTVAVRVFTEVAGRRTVVSHAAKHTRGLVARWLLEAPSPPRTPAQVAAVIADHARVELLDHGRPGYSLDVLL